MRIVVTGASGQLGAYLLDRLANSVDAEVYGWCGTSAICTSRGIALRSLDLADGPAIEDELNRVMPSRIFHLAAISSADAAFRDPARATMVNVRATETLARWCRHNGCRLISTSTDLVFDGSRKFSNETDPTSPLSVYGRTKRDGETSVLELPDGLGLVARLSLLYGAARSGRPCPFDRTIASLRRGETCSFFEDEFRTPLHLGAAADLLVRLADAEAAGLFHVGGEERLSRAELIRRCGIALGINPAQVRANRQADAPSTEPRPADTSLDTSKLARLLPGHRRPTLEESLAAWPAEHGDGISQASSRGDSRAG